MKTNYTEEANVILDQMRNEANLFAVGKLKEHEAETLDKRIKMDAFVGKAVIGKGGEKEFVDRRLSPVYCSEDGVLLPPEAFDYVMASMGGITEMTAEEINEEMTKVTKDTHRPNHGKPYEIEAVHADRLERNEKIIKQVEDARQWREDVIISLDRDELLVNTFTPTNEFETIFLWSHAQLDSFFGFKIVRLKINKYPDAIYETAEGDTVFLEFEYKSSNFYLHGHDIEKTDLLVCWINNSDVPVPTLELHKAYDPETLTFDTSKLTFKTP